MGDIEQVKEKGGFGGKYKFVMKWFRKSQDIQNALVCDQNIYKYFIFILFLQVISIAYWGNIKEGYFGDELYSYQFVCQTDYPSINSDRWGGRKLLK